MPITRRDAIAGFTALAGTLAAMPAKAREIGGPGDAARQAASEVQGADQKPSGNQKPILGPAVFHWSDLKPVKNDAGAQAPVCRQPTATLDQLEMHVSTLNPGQMSHPPHKHANEELIILKEGVCETLSDGQWVRVEVGDVVFNASNSLHAFRNVGQWPAVYHVIAWNTDKTAAQSQ
jgi:XRE family transcriptional regulator, regulator of sulfur utilization